MVEGIFTVSSDTVMKDLNFTNANSYVLNIRFLNVIVKLHFMNHGVVILLHIFGKRKIKTNNFFASVTKSVVIFRVTE